MLTLPPLPGWDALHPLIIHFPIALLFVAPLFVLIGAVLPPKKGRPILWTALLLMAVGTASVFVAIETGEAAGKLADRTAEITAALEHHENLAERTRLVFSTLTALFGILLVVPLLRRSRLPGRLSSTILPLVFLAFYGGGMLLLTQTADQGGRLVHQFGVHALIPAEPTQQPAAQSGE
jgi:uncharacterized membrane protein